MFYKGGKRERIDVKKCEKKMVILGIYIYIVFFFLFIVYSANSLPLCMYHWLSKKRIYTYMYVCIAKFYLCANLCIDFIYARMGI